MSTVNVYPPLRKDRSRNSDPRSEKSKRKVGKCEETHMDKKEKDTGYHFVCILSYLKPPLFDVCRLYRRTRQSVLNHRILYQVHDSSNITSSITLLILGPLSDEPKSRV